MTKNTAINFARLDYFTIKPYLTWKSILIFLAVIVFLAYGTSEAAMIVSMCMMYSVIFACYPFAVGDKNSLDTLYFTLPVTKKNIVIGRYLFTISLNLIMLVISYLISLIIITALNVMSFDPIVNLLTALVCFALFTFIEAIQLPIYFKLGYTKAKFLAYIPLIAFPASVVAMTAIVDRDKLISTLTNVIAWMGNNIIITVLACLAVWLGIMFLSMLLSLKFYAKREFWLIFVICYDIMCIITKKELYSYEKSCFYYTIGNFFTHRNFIFVPG